MQEQSLSYCANEYEEVTVWDTEEMDKKSADWDKNYLSGDRKSLRAFLALAQEFFW